MKPLAIDLFCGLGGWTEGLLSEGYDVVGFDIERRPYPGQLVLQDVLTIHGSQFKDAALIVASPPCQAYSYRAMPWKRAKALPPPDNTLFEACFRIQREASEAATMTLGCANCGIYHPATKLDSCNFKPRHIPLVIENVKGAQPWVGRAKWHFGSFYLWGDVPAIMPIAKGIKNGSLGGGSWFGLATTNTVLGMNPDGRKIAHAAKQFDGVKVSGLNWSGSDKPGYKARAFNTTAEQRFGGRDSAMDSGTSKGAARKAASAQIAKIPFPLAQHIARVYKDLT